MTGTYAENGPRGDDPFSPPAAQQAPRTQPDALCRLPSLTQGGQQPPGPSADMARARGQRTHAGYALRRLADRVPERAVVLHGELGAEDLMALVARPQRHQQPAAVGAPRWLEGRCGRAVTHERAPVGDHLPG